MQAKAMDRATQLLLDLCGGEAGEVVAAEAKEHLPTPATIVLRRIKLDNLLGHHIEDADVVEILTRLGCQVTAIDGGWSAVTPTWRFDLNIEEDLVEEVGRIYGYNNIPNQAPVAALSMNLHKEAKLPLKRVRDLLADRGYQEAITYSFVEPEQQKLIAPEIEPIILPFPISADMSAMRVSLWTGLLNTVVFNQKRQQPRVRLFESGLRFISDENAENGIRQEVMLAGVIAGNLTEEHWDLSTRAVDFFDLKGDLEAVLELTAHEGEFSFKAGTHPALHTGQTAVICLNGKEVGFIGTIHPELERKFGLNGRTVVFEVEWDAINTRSLPEAKGISKFPANRRDLAVVVEESINAGDVLAVCRAHGGALLKSVNLFDVYRGQGVGEGKKSLAIALTLQSVERTLEEADITNSVSEILATLTEQFNAVLRD
jgi:phenylalanyl-tRNA synthetase beta chain